MYDPIGGFDRIKEQFGAYLDTAFRVEDPGFARARRDLLAEVGTLALDPIFEVVPRYEQWRHGLEELAIADSQNVLVGFEREAKEAFVDLALSGLFRSEPSSNPIRKAGVFRPYVHQIEMLRKGVADGMPGIVTSGTGSGKTESFLLPVFAQIAKEAVSWPAPRQPLDDDWLDPRRKFAYHRRNEHPDRPKALRAIVIYPLNALVEDQLVRLRRALDSTAARDVMLRRFAGNGIYFGRYTGPTPVAGFREHPRNDEAWRKKRTQKTARTREELRGYRDIQRRIVEDGGDEDLRFVFPATDGNEMLTRWDIQYAPPDILVTNQAMLNAMMVREVDAPVFDKTRAWIESDDEARFFLVMDELHLVRGSGGAELAGLLRAMVDRLGLNHPEHRHKLRVLASSASLPVTEALAPKSTRYLIDMFGAGGTFREHGSSPDLEDAWRNAVVGGAPVATELPPGEVDRAPLQAVAVAVDKALADPACRPELDGALMAAASSLPGVAAGDDPRATLEAAVAASAALLEGTMRVDEDPTRRTSRTIGEIGDRLFGASDRQAVRGLALIRSVPDMPDTLLADELRPRPKLMEKLPAFRAHLFMRSGRSLRLDLRSEEGKNVWGRPSIERGEDFEKAEGSDVARRLFEVLYCEACGDLYAGGRRGGSSDGRLVSLLPSPENLEKLPESPTALRFENASFEEFALFWPGTVAPVDSADQTFTWLPAFLDPYTGIVGEDGTADVVPGFYLHRLGDQKDRHGRTAASGGTAVPYACAKCGTDYSGRYRAPNSLKREGRLSPIRSFRTGFAKTSQLLATELVGALKAQGGDGKLVAFSDSREDAANLALDVEVQHQRDLRREILVSAALDAAAASAFRPEDEAKMDALKADATAKFMAGDLNGAAPLLAEFKELDERKKNSNSPPAVPLAKLFEFNRGSDETGKLRPVLSNILSIGSNPVEGADVRSNRVKGRPWYEFFVKGDDGWAWNLNGRDQQIALVGAARERVAREQIQEVGDLLFSKTYFALEETGHGWPSFFPVGPYGDEESPMDAWLRILSDAYRVLPNRFSDENNVKAWQDAKDVLGKAGSRLDLLLPKVFTPKPVRDAVDEMLGKLRGGKLPAVAHNLTIDVSALFFRPASPDGPALRCQKCARVHLHRGFGRCTRCGETLPTSTGLTAGDVVMGNFLGRKVQRARSSADKPFRLKCEELTGQTKSPAQRLQQFKGVFVREDDESRETFDSRARFEQSDLLSVTTTMEVGVDIGSLQAVYQGNMPPTVQLPAACRARRPSRSVLRQRAHSMPQQEPRCALLPQSHRDDGRVSTAALRHDGSD